MAALGHDTGLDERQLRKVWRILEPFRSQIEHAALFGSRATGAYRSNSDIDLVLYGPIDGATVDRLWTRFDESNLSLTVDVIAYDGIKNSRLREHIDRFAKPLPSVDSTLDTALVKATSS